jgi:hypothetical protein
LASGTKLALEPRQGRLAVVNGEGGALLGYLEDGLASHLLNLIHLGNSYSAHLMTSGDNPHVFLREVSQSEQAAKFVSFARVHSALTPSSVKSGLTDDFVPADEENEGWEGDELSEDSDDGDDFNSMSLESLRDEEDDDYNPRRDDY